MDTKIIETEWDPRFLKGMEEFNQGLFFECHETLEEIWLEERGSDRYFYQGIIQIAAGYFKWEQRVPMGAIKLLGSGLEKLEAYTPIYHGMNLDSLMETVRDHLKEIEAYHQRQKHVQGGGKVPILRSPHISLQSERTVE